MNGVTKTGEDWQNEYFVAHFQGSPITFVKNRWTGEMRMSADDVIKALGLGDNFNEFISTDDGLDFINDWKRDHPDIPFFGGVITKTNAQ